MRLKPKVPLMPIPEHTCPRNVSCNSSERTVIYATHQLEFLEAADFVLVIKDGHISLSGKSKELIADPNGELHIQNLYSKFGLVVRKIPQNTLLIAVTQTELLSAWYMRIFQDGCNPKAPILHQFSESITGAATIRCFNKKDHFLKKVRSVIDDFSGVAFHNYATSKWLYELMNFLFNLAFFIVLIVLVTLPASAIYPSLTRLAAPYFFNLMVLQAWLSKIYAMSKTQ